MYPGTFGSRGFYGNLKIVTATVGCVSSEFKQITEVCLPLFLPLQRAAESFISPRGGYDLWNTDFVYEVCAIIGKGKVMITRKLYLFETKEKFQVEYFL